MKQFKLPDSELLRSAGTESEIQKLISGASRDIQRQKDEYILSFFPSEEYFRSVAHLLIWEEYPMEFSEPNFPNNGLNDFNLTITQRVRLRWKTPEELAEDEARKERENDERTDPESRNTDSEE